MKKITLLLVFILIAFHSYSQTPVEKRNKEIKQVYLDKITQLSDSAIVYPITGLTNITNRGAHLNGITTMGIELWIIDATGKVIYNNIVETGNRGYSVVDAEYSRYMKLQSNYLMHHSTVASR
jgi:hypothetical protein